MSLRLIARAAGRHPSGSIVLALWLLFVSGTPAFAAALELIPPAEGDYRAGEAIAFDVSQLPDEVAPRLALEIDDVNVTEFVRREGSQAILDLPVPLEAGLRNIRVVDYQPDGTIEEIGFWTIEVTAAQRDPERRARRGCDGRLRLPRRRSQPRAPVAVLGRPRSHAPLGCARFAGPRRRRRLADRRPHPGALP